MNDETATLKGETMTRVPDSDRDVYGTWVTTVVNATRHAMRSNVLMSQEELEIVEGVEARLLELDPLANGVRKAKVVIR